MVMPNAAAQRRPMSQPESQTTAVLDGFIEILPMPYFVHAPRSDFRECSGVLTCHNYVVLKTTLNCFIYYTAARQKMQ